MKPITSFQIHSTTIAQKRQDGLDFVKMGAIEDARRVALELYRMDECAGTTSREASRLSAAILEAYAEIFTEIAFSQPA